MQRFSHTTQGTGHTPSVAPYVLVAKRLIVDTLIALTGFVCTEVQQSLCTLDHPGLAIYIISVHSLMTPVRVKQALPFYVND